MSSSSVHLCLVLICLSACLDSMARAAESAPQPKDLPATLRTILPSERGVPVIDVSKLSPEQKHFLAMRMELIRRRRDEMAAKGITSKGNDDLDGANTLGFGAAALPFLGLYGLGLGGLGVGLGPLAFTGFLG